MRRKCATGHGARCGSIIALLTLMMARNALALACVALVVAMAALSVVIHLATRWASDEVWMAQVAATPEASESPAPSTSVVHIRAEDLPRVYAELFGGGTGCDRAGALGLEGSDEPTTVHRYPPTGPTEVVEVLRGDRRTLVILE